MPDNSKITLKQLIDAMNKVKEYVDAEISVINNNNRIPCTGIVLSTDTLLFTTNATQTLEAVVNPSNTTDTVIWSVSPSGIATVNNGVVTPVSNGSCTITVTCGSKSATCNVTVALPVPEITLTLASTMECTKGQEFNINYSTNVPVVKHELGFDGSNYWEISPTDNGNNSYTYTHESITDTTWNPVARYFRVTDANGNTASGSILITINETTSTPVLYELAAAKTFNGTTDYLDTGVCLLTGDNLNKDWTMLIDFTPTSINQASIIHCMTEASGWPGLYLNILNNTGNIQMVFPNNSSNNNIVTVTANQRVKFVIKKVGNTFTVYDSTMSSLHTNTPNTINTTPNAVLLGAIQVYSATQGKTTYSRFFKGTIHRFKIVEGDMSSSECLNWMA